MGATVGPVIMVFLGEVSGFDERARRAGSRMSESSVDWILHARGAMISPG